MKPVDGYKSEARSNGYPMLPKGLYIAGIQNVKIEGTEPDQRLVLRLDIIEGEYTAYYTKRYNNDASAGGRYEVKYKGDYRIQIPNQANPKREHFDWDLRALNNAMWAIEDSNDGYHWDWNEAGLRGKMVGINVREGSFNGVPYTQIGRLESVKMIREGKCKVMSDMKPRTSGDSDSGRSQAAAAPSFMVVEEEVPF